MILCFSVKVFYFLQENFNVWIEEKHKIIDVPFLSQLIKLDNQIKCNNQDVTPIPPLSFLLNYFIQLRIQL